MKNNDVLVNKLIEDEKKLKYKIEKRNLYNIKSLPLKLLIKSGIAIDCALPYILATIILSNTPLFNENSPFFTDKIIEKARVETIDTSNGFHIEHLSYDYYYSDKFLEHSTGWVRNDEGLYERVVTSYKLNDDIDLTDTNKILSMTKEEIENIVEIEDVNKIEVSTIDPDDYIYDSDCLIVVNNFVSEKDFIIRDENASENIFYSLFYISLSLGLGYIFSGTKKFLFKNKFRDNLNYYNETLRSIKVQI